MELKRAVGLFTLTMYGVGIILGAGVYAIYKLWIEKWAPFDYVFDRLV